MQIMAEEESKTERSDWKAYHIADYFAPILPTQQDKC